MSCLTPASGRQVHTILLSAAIVSRQRLTGSAIPKFESFRSVATINNNCHSGARSCASPESITPAGDMDCGPAPLAGYRRPIRARRAGRSPTGPRKARPDDRLRRNPPLPESKDGGLRFAKIRLRAIRKLGWRVRVLPRIQLLAICSCKFTRRVKPAGFRYVRKNRDQTPPRLNGARDVRGPPVATSSQTCAGRSAVPP